MKKITTTILLFAAFISISYGQTTEEEYNYMTKGYQIQISSGLDMKKGYSVGETITITEGLYVFNFIPLIRANKTDSTIVGYIIKAVSNAWNNTYWYCFPLGSKELLERTFSSVGTLDKPMTTAFFKAYVYFITIMN